MAKYAIRRGHQRTGNDGCAVGILNEIDVANIYYSELMNNLRILGHEVLDVTPPEANRSLADSLNYGINKANSWGADYFISCHANKAYDYYEGSIGCEVLYSGGSSNGKQLAINVEKEIASIGFKSRGAKADVRGLAELRGTNMTAIIIEPFFLEATEDVANWNRVGGKGLANAITKGLTGQVIQENISNTNTVQTPVSTPKQEQSKSPIQKAREFVGNRCKELQEKLIALGYNCGGYGADGDFGQGTYDSLIQFQKDYLANEVDGLAGTNVFNKLNELINKKNQPKVESYDFRSLQGFIGAGQDNVPGTETLGKCPLIKYGSNGEIVRWVQNRLNFLGFNCGTADGVFGNMTKQAIVNFQKAKNLSQDGIVGKQSWSKLLGL